MPRRHGAGAASSRPARALVASLVLVGAALLAPSAVRTTMAHADGRALLVLVDDALEAGDRSSPGRAEERRADAIVLVRWARACDELHVTSVPRDLVAGEAGEPLAVVFGTSGPAGVAAAIEPLLDVDVFASVTLDLADVAALASSVGPVTVDLPIAGRDQRTGFMGGPGDVVLDGADAVAYLRARTWEELHEGRWRLADPSDEGRTARLHAYLASAIPAVAATGLPDTIRLGVDGLRRAEVDIDDAAAAAGFLAGARTTAAVRFDAVAVRDERTVDERRSPFALDHLGAMQRTVLADRNGPLPAACNGGVTK